MGNFSELTVALVELFGLLGEANKIHVTKSYLYLNSEPELNNYFSRFVYVVSVKST